MRDIIQKVSHTDKQITLALLRVWLSYLFSLTSTGAGAISIFSIAAILLTAPAKANLSEQSPQTTKGDNESISEINSLEQQQEKLNLDVSDYTEHDPSGELPNQLTPVSDRLADNISAAKELPQEQSEGLVVTVKPSSISEALIPKPPVAENTENSIKYHLPGKLVVNVESTAMSEGLVSKPPVVETMPNWLAQNLSEKLTVAAQPMVAPDATVLLPGENNFIPHSPLQKTHSPLLAQSSEEKKPDASLIPENSPKKSDALTPTLDVQGVYLNQGDDAARLRLRGIYPVSPHALFGAIVDLASGSDFQGTEGTGVSLSELYFTGSLPNYSNLRLTAGLMDLTSYFDRNSFAKDSTTHFFHPLFQTNPALASAGIGSRPGALLNWNITDNIEAKAAVFSSERNLGDFGLNAFASEIGFRAGTGIFRATYATDKDKGRGGVFGTREGDRENAFGLNGEYYIPQIKMGLFARYGWLENTDRDKNAETYSFGINFLDMFVKDARLGLGYAYGPDFSKNDDVWELFYDMRIARGLRAGITLQERDGFSETIVGFRVKTDIQLYP
ncbi:hypothetical protein [Limnofasciculus baicalensis]|uniref:Porin n=1 Tax=Limnofasciculus baicalensis BBK-W-15 TaxID=2699891 RepID=A0AAE3GVI1_9CYAN|nr:hypothetical protein [Limnofasciculus baicalensis]MCP2730716.1 hypothetical protein [Limnofasciculus baicalensis BBK-W-15]